MKQNRIINSLLVCLAVFFAACSEEVYSPSFSESKNVTVNLNYADASPRAITINTRATTDEEKALDDLYIYVFDEDGNLKGFKALTSGLTQNTSDTQNITGDVKGGIKTKSGASYIYAVANINTGLYPVATSNGSVEDDKLPIGLDETKAQAGDYASFTKDKLMKLLFTRNAKSIQISSKFLMSGSLNGGDVVNISDNTTNPTITDENGNTVDVIKLRRVVSKVKFTVTTKAVASNDTVTSRNFTLSSYDIMNIAYKGNLVADNNTAYKSTESSNFSNLTGEQVGTQDFKDGKYTFNFYLPENLQDAKNTSAISKWDDREADDQGDNATTKTFTNAPTYGTYIVLKGKYSEEKSNGTTRNADVSYYIHLGDCSEKVTDFNVERNCEYTYNVTVAGVGKIMVEAEKSTQDQPGAEGVVLEFGSAGKSLTLDAHYEYMVMRFYQDDIKKLKEAGHGYFYQVKTINGTTDVIEVKDDEIESSKLNGVDTDWIEFAIKNGNSTSSYGTDNDGRGKPCTYPGHETKGTLKTGLYSVDSFLKNLYSNANTDSYWTGSDSNGKYIDATCFVSENYYANKTWDQYVNTDNRYFYIANAVQSSKDGRSIYAKVQYGLDQYAIQTFYNRDKASSLVAYGCETVDETGADGKKTETSGEHTLELTSGNESADWNGRDNMLTDLKSFLNQNNSWSNLTTSTTAGHQNGYNSYGGWVDEYPAYMYRAKYQCLKRNRDLNGDGKITEDEVRWYTPTIKQLSGLWIGEDALSTKSRLYNKQTSSLGSYSSTNSSYDYNNKGRMLYWAATTNLNSFFSEEGMATGLNYSGGYYPKHIKCVRNLSSNDEGYGKEPATYYQTSGMTISLENVDAKALNITGETGELTAHNERQEGNKPAIKFTAASNTYSTKNNKGNSNTTMKQVVEGTVNCSRYSQNNKKWRVPNQREFCLIGVALGYDKIKNNFCRTIFSNPNFRYSWTYTTVITMNQPKESGNHSIAVTGAIRCISVEK